MNLFWVVFYGICTKTLLVMQGKVMHDICGGFSCSLKIIDICQKTKFLALRGFRFTLSWKYIIMVSFIRIAFAIANLKVFKVFRTIPASMKWPFLGGFWALTPPNMVQYCHNSHQRWYSSKQKVCLKNIWRIWVFMKKGRTQGLHFWSNFDHPFPPEDGQNRKR